MRIDDFHEGQRAQKPPEREREADKPENASRASDKVELSRDAEDRSRSHDARLDDVRTKVENGTYTKPSVADSVAERIIRSHDLEGSPHMGADKTDDNRDDSAEIRQDKVDEAKQRISLGEYSDEEVMKIIADRILHRLSAEKRHDSDKS
jgi:anti-sigma28 factor (negative regulator of flagellin synthesis)